MDLDVSDVREYTKEKGSILEMAVTWVNKLQIAGSLF